LSLCALPQIFLLVIPAKAGIQLLSWLFECTASEKLCISRRDQDGFPLARE
jgi:hypothetical protein